MVEIGIVKTWFTHRRVQSEYATLNRPVLSSLKQYSPGRDACCSLNARVDKNGKTEFL